MTTESNDVIATQLEQLYALYSMQSILQEIYQNLALIEEGQTGKTINVSNTSLFYLAAKYYGDATYWNVIAEANGLFDPFITDTIQITIPTTPGVSTGGILSY